MKVVVSSQALLKYAQDLKDVGQNGVNLPDSLRKNFFEAANKVYLLAEHMVELERGKMMKEYTRFL